MIKIWYDYSERRKEFTEYVCKYFDADKFYEIIETGYKTEDFICYKVEDEYYIIDLDTGIIVNFYKHIGRCLNCNSSNIFALFQTIKRLFLDRRA